MDEIEPAAQVRVAAESCTDKAAVGVLLSGVGHAGLGNVDAGDGRV